jgi:hypothetical protein
VPQPDLAPSTASAASKARQVHLQQDLEGLRDTRLGMFFIGCALPVLRTSDDDWETTTGIWDRTEPDRTLPVWAVPAGQ